MEFQRSFSTLAARSLRSIVDRGLDPDLSWFRASTRQVDRHRSVVEPAGLDLKDYGGIFGWGHDVYGRYDGSAPPPENVLGHVDATDQEKEFLDIGVRWADHERANLVRDMVEEGFINHVSVGFIPTKMGDLWLSEDGEIVDSEPEEGVSEYIAHYQEGELLEVSVAVIPSNSGAEALSAVRRCVEAGLPATIVLAATPPASAAAIGSAARETTRALARVRIARARARLAE